MHHDANGQPHVVANLSSRLTDNEQQQLGVQFATSGTCLNLLTELQEFYANAAHCFPELPEVLADLMRRTDAYLRANGRTPQQPIWETDQEMKNRRARERRMAKKEQVNL